MSGRSFPIVGEDLKRWANTLTSFLGRIINNLEYRNDKSVANENGIMLWDNEYGYPVVSKDGVWRQITLADGYALLNKATSVSAG